MITKNFLYNKIALLENDLLLLEQRVEMLENKKSSKKQGK